MGGRVHQNLREPQRHARALRLAGRDVEPAADVRQQGAHQVEPEAHPLAGLLGRQERLAQASGEVRRDARALVLHTHEHGARLARELDADDCRRGRRRGAGRGGGVQGVVEQGAERGLELARREGDRGALRGAQGHGDGGGGVRPAPDLDGAPRPPRRRASSTARADRQRPPACA